MHEAHVFLQNLALVLCAAAVTSVVFQRLHQPVVLGYLLAGMIIGPHIPVPLVADEATVHALSELGVIMLMFSLGLEFTLTKLVSVGPTASVVAVVQCSLMLWLGYVTGQLFGWTVLESLYAGAIIAISSTTIIIKAFAEQRVRGPVADIVFGVLIVEDLIAILLLTVLTTVSSGESLSIVGLAATGGKLLGFLGALLAAGLLTIPRLMRMLVRVGSPETTLVTSIGICFASALLAQYFGYSVALGAFLAGSLVAESGEGPRIEHLVQGVRDMFGAIFFVAVGMLIHPALIAEHWQAVAVLTLLVILGKILSVGLGVFLMGQGIRTAVQAGMGLAQIGEFSFIIAGLGLSLRATGDFLYPVAVAVSAITTLLTPWLIRASNPVASFIDRSLPKPIQTFVGLYGSWVERLRTVRRRDSTGSRVRRVARLLLIDAILVAAIVAGASTAGATLAAQITARLALPDWLSRLTILLGAGALCLPFCVGMVRCAQALGVILGTAALPRAADGGVDLADAPRRALVVTLQLTVLLLVGAPLIAITQPFLPPFQGAAVLAVVLIVFGIGFWRSAANLQGHARAGAEMIVEALLQQVKSTSSVDDHALDAVHKFLPGLGAPVPIRVEATSYAVGKTLAQINLRGLTTATVLAIIRGNERVVVPTGREALQAGDVLAVAGTSEALVAARRLLLAGEADTRAELRSPGGWGDTDSDHAAPATEEARRRAASGEE